jgi:hypothetical protein
MHGKSNSKTLFFSALFYRCYAGNLLRFFEKTLWRAQTDRQRGGGKLILSPAASAHLLPENAGQTTW